MWNKKVRRFIAYSFDFFSDKGDVKDKGIGEVASLGCSKVA